MKTQNRCRLHRFHDSVGFHFDDTATLYIQEEMARKVAAELLAIADDIRDCGDFSRSEMRPATIEVEPTT